jgi:hypothetical protein
MVQGITSDCLNIKRVAVYHIYNMTADVINEKLAQFLRIM